MGIQDSGLKAPGKLCKFRTIRRYARGIRDMLVAKGYCRSSAHNRGSQPRKMLLLLGVLDA